MKKVIATIIMIIILVVSCNSVFASEKMTIEDLDKAIEKFNESKEFNSKIERDDNYLKIISKNSDESMRIKYYIQDNLIIEGKSVYTKNMDSEAFDLENSKMIASHILGFILVAMYKNIDYSVAVAYMGLNMPNELYQQNYDINKESFDAIKKASEMFDAKIEYDNLYYTIKIEKESSTEDEYAIKYSCEYKFDEDYSKMEEIYIKQFENMEDKLFSGVAEGFEQIIKEMEEIKNDIKLKVPQTENSNIEKLPQTGRGFEISDLLWIVLGVSVVSFGGYVIYNRRKDGNI